MRIKRHKISLFLLFLCAFYSVKSYAQNEATNLATENIAIAFYKTGGVVPNFDRWIREREPYIHTPWARRETLYENEMNRLQIAYHNFNPEKETILIRTSAYIETKTSMDSEGNEIYSIKSTFKEAPEALYFPYDFMGERIIVMPYGLEDIMQATINEAQFNYIKKRSNFKKELLTIIRMQPHESDFSKPYKIDGMEQWVFKTKIASIEFWDEEKSTLLWEHTADWYTSLNSIEINDLYKDRPFGSKKGTVKPTTNLPKE